jgi:hypothetical protein
LVPYEELAAASGEKQAAEKEEAINEAYTQVETDATRGVRLVPVLDIPSSAEAAGAGAFVSLAGPFHWPQQAGLPTCTPRSASRFELSQLEPNRLRLIRAAE